MPLKKNRTACKNTYLVACGGPSQSVHRRARSARPQQITTEKGGQAYKRRYSRASCCRPSPRATLPAPTPGKTRGATRFTLNQPRDLCSESPSHSPKCCKPTQWRQLNHKGILAEESSTPKSNNGGPHENARRPRARAGRSATSQRQHAHAEAPGLH